MVHRDIKPGNIALRDGDWSRPVLLDLGLARSADEATITVYPAAVGTAWYMAPEQLEGRRARKAADLFAVGVDRARGPGRRHPFYDDGASYTYADMTALIAKGPHPLPAGTPGRGGRPARPPDRRARARAGQRFEQPATARPGRIRRPRT